MVGRDLKNHPVPILCHGHRHLPSDHAAPSPIQPGFYCLWYHKTYCNKFLFLALFNTLQSAQGRVQRLVHVKAAFQSRCRQYHLNFILSFFLGLFLASLTLFNLFFLPSSAEWSAGAPMPAQELHPFGTSSATDFRLDLCQSLCPGLKPTRQASRKAQIPPQTAQSHPLRLLNY